MTTAIIVFAKAPVPGLAKTRLAPALGAQGAAALAERMLHHTLAQAVAAGQTWLGYNDLQWLMHRHGSRDCPAAEPVGKALAGIAAAVVAK